MIYMTKAELREVFNTETKVKYLKRHLISMYKNRIETASKEECILEFIDGNDFMPRKDMLEITKLIAEGL